MNHNPAPHETPQNQFPNSLLGIASRASRHQFKQPAAAASDITIIIDDFDECQLSDAAKEKIVSDLIKNYSSVVITSYSHAPSVLFTSSDKPNPDLFEISPFGDEKLSTLVKRWKALGSPAAASDNADLATFELLQKLFSQTEVDKYPGSALQFLQLIENSSGSDITQASYAACYETLVSSHITKVRPNWQNLDEAKNFISLLAFTSYQQTASPSLSSSTFEECLQFYKTNFFSSVRDLKEVALGAFLDEVENGYSFREEYQWYFLCARHAAKVLQSGPEYDSFVMECTSGIFQKQYANMTIFMAYFTDDNMILSLLLDIVDGLFSRAPGWELSDKQKTIMLGLTTGDNLTIQSSTDVSVNRQQILREKITNIIEQAEEAVAQYTLPFLHPEIDDSEYVREIDPEAVTSESYMRSLNALMRVHSVLGQILASRSGTFDSKTMLDCITRMVKASGRYIALNHAIAAVLVSDRQAAVETVDEDYDSSTLGKEEKFDKIERIFSFWSVFTAQAGLARYLSHDHAIRALRMLSARLESAEGHRNGEIPFNFTSVLVIASLYRSGQLDRDLFEVVIERYGENSALMQLLRVSVHFYSYYMPLGIQDKQWLGTKLKMPLRRIEAQRRKAVFAGRALPSPVKLTNRKLRKPRPRPRRHT